MKKQNKETFQKLITANPRLTHVYIRRTTMDGSIIDIPIRSVEGTLKVNPSWEIMGGDTTASPATSNSDLPKVPPRPAPISNKEFHTVMSGVASSSTARKFVYVRTPSGKIVDIPLKQLEATLKQPGMSLVSREVADKSIEAPVVDTNVLECPLCGFVAKTKSGVRLHNKKHQ